MRMIHSLRNSRLRVRRSRNANASARTSVSLTGRSSRRRPPVYPLAFWNKRFFLRRRATPIVVRIGGTSRLELARPGPHRSDRGGRYSCPAGLSGCTVVLVAVAGQRLFDRLRIAAGGAGRSAELADPLLILAGRQMARAGRAV